MDRSTTASSREGPTIRDVARAARVSPSTVSNLLNGRDGKMRPRTRRRVLRAIEELGYRPSRVARQLRTGRADTIGLIVPSVANPSWGRFARAVEGAALGLGYQVLLCNSERDPERERVYVEELMAGGTRAVILATSLPSLTHLEPAMARGLQLVAFDRVRQDDDPPSVVNVSVDNIAGGRVATEHLLSLGHRRIGFLSGAIATVSRQLRIAGYRQALDAAGIRFDDDLVWRGGSRRAYGDVSGAELGFEGTGALLELPAAPTAIVAINDMHAFGACAAVHDRGRRVPEDVSVVGFDDISLAEMFNPPLTTVRQPVEDMARYAVAAIHERSGDRAGEVASVVMAPRLMVRRSAAPHRRRGRRAAR